VDDFLATLEAAYLYAKTVTLGMHRWRNGWRHYHYGAIVPRLHAW
jgi:hypothetical protein